MRRDQTILAVITLGLLGYGFYQAIYVAPTEQTMGDIQRIFYYHVPCGVDGGRDVLRKLRREPGLPGAPVAGDREGQGMIGNVVAAICVIATLVWRDRFTPGR